MNEDRALELMNSVNPFGPLHIVVEDGNLHDNHLAMVRDEVEADGTAEEKELLTILSGMSEDDRYALWDQINDNHC